MRFEVSKPYHGETKSVWYIWDNDLLDWSGLSETTLYDALRTADRLNDKEDCGNSGLEESRNGRAK
jgi:hypothetical protein